MATHIEDVIIRVSMQVRNVTESLGKMVKPVQEFSYAFKAGRGIPGRKLSLWGRLGKSLGGVFRSLGFSTKRFNAELLSVLFTGMWLQRVFGGFVNEALKTAGVFDVLGAVMTAILLPVLMPLVQIFYRLINEVMKNPALKKFIAFIVILGAVFGVLLSVIAMVALAVLAFEGAGAAAAIAIAAAIAALVAFIVTNWDSVKEYFENVFAKMIDLLYHVFIAPFVTFFSWLFGEIIPAILHGLLTGDWSSFIEALKSGFKGFGEWVRDLFLKIHAYFYAVFGPIIDFFKGVAGGIGSFFANIFGWETSPALKAPAPAGGGETSITQNQNTFNIEAVIKDDYDVDKLAERIKELWGDELGGI